MVRGAVELESTCRLAKRSTSTMGEWNLSNEEEPKIIVDEDWKSQVEAERHQAEEPTTEEEAGPKFPPPSLELLISTMATQAVMSLGLAPDPMTQKAAVNLEMAKFHIDMLGVLESKTSGNRSPEEEKLVTDSLHELRMLYVNVSKSPEQFAPPAEEDDEDKGPSIVTP